MCASIQGTLSELPFQKYFFVRILSFICLLMVVRQHKGVCALESDFYSSSRFLFSVKKKKKKRKAQDREIANKIVTFILALKIFLCYFIQVPWLPRLNQLQMILIFLNLSSSTSTYYTFIIDYICAMSTTLSVPRLQSELTTALMSEL